MLRKKKVVDRPLVRELTPLDFCCSFELQEGFEVPADTDLVSEEHLHGEELDETF